MSDAPPAAFVERLAGQLGGELPAYLEALQRPAEAGLRLNRLKLDGEPAEIAAMCDGPVAWCDDGWHLKTDVAAGKHPFHAAGLYYLQEPAAMAVAAVVGPQPGDWVIDLCAAPGGKATHLLSLMRDNGVLVANEVAGGRVGGLLSNLERWGGCRVMAVSRPAEKLAALWPGWFDRVLVDAPCSGEGMFRKTPATVGEWSEANVAGCAARQKRLLRSAAELVRPGGVLVYSTCTFAPEENERQVESLLRDRPDFVIDAADVPGLRPGPFVHLWPHRDRGEGHFVARLRRVDGREVPRGYADRPGDGAAAAAWREFVSGVLTVDPFGDWAIVFDRDRVLAVPAGMPSVDFRPSRSGVWLGAVKNRRFEPSHTLALTLRMDDAESLLDLPLGDERLGRYLAGHPLPEPGADGWALICAAGHPVGWGRRAKGVIKNAYPKGLRVP